MIAIIILWMLYILMAFYMLLNKAPSCRLTEEELQAGRELQKVTFIESFFMNKPEKQSSRNAGTCEESMFGFDLFEKKRPRR